MDKYVGPENLKFAPNLETLICLAIILFLVVFFIVIGIIFTVANKKKLYTQRPKGIILLMELAVEKIDGFVFKNMGEGFEMFGGIFLAIIPYLVLNFIIGITGLPTPMSYLPVPLSLGLTTFILIHATSIRFKGWKYFKRYIDPFPFFLPINLLSMWAPLLSLTLRLFGNALVGWVLITLANWGCYNLSAMITGISEAGPQYFMFAPFLTPVLHAYFDVFSTYIQTLVFITLTALFVAQEKPEPKEEKDSLALRGSRKEITQ